MGATGALKQFEIRQQELRATSQEMKNQCRRININCKSCTQRLPFPENRLSPSRRASTQAESYPIQSTSDEIIWAKGTLQGPQERAQLYVSRDEIGNRNNASTNYQG